MKGKILKVVKKSEGWWVTGKAPISTKWVDTVKTRDMGGVVHGDDFAWEGRDEDLDWVDG